MTEWKASLLDYCSVNSDFSLGLLECIKSRFDNNLLLSIGMNCVVIVGSIVLWLKVKRKKLLVKNEATD